MFDRAIGLHDEQIVSGELPRWHLGDRVLAETQDIERVSWERTHRCFVRNRNGLPALSPLELGQFFGERLTPGLVRGRRQGRAHCQQCQTESSDDVGRHSSPCARAPRAQASRLLVLHAPVTAVIEAVVMWALAYRTTRVAVVERTKLPLVPLMLKV